MDFSLIFEGKATLEELLRLYELGFYFDIEDGKITKIYQLSKMALEYEKKRGER